MNLIEILRNKKKPTSIGLTMGNCDFGYFIRPYLNMGDYSDSLIAKMLNIPLHKYIMLIQQGTTYAVRSEQIYFDTPDQCQKAIDNIKDYINGW